MTDKNKPSRRNGALQRISCACVDPSKRKELERSRFDHEHPKIRQAASALPGLVTHKNRGCKSKNSASAVVSNSTASVALLETMRAVEAQQFLLCGKCANVLRDFEVDVNCHEREFRHHDDLKKRLMSCIAHAAKVLKTSHFCAARDVCDVLRISRVASRRVVIDA